jgi:hypothetical protein
MIRIDTIAASEEVPAVIGEKIKDICREPGEDEPLTGFVLRRGTTLVCPTCSIVGNPLAFWDLTWDPVSIGGHFAGESTWLYLPGSSYWLHTNTEGEFFLERAHQFDGALSSLGANEIWVLALRHEPTTELVAYQMYLEGGERAVPDTAPAGRPS